jgi:hypothetical protein
VASRVPPLGYDVLRKLAAQRMAQEQPGPKAPEVCHLAHMKE